MKRFKKIILAIIIIIGLMATWFIYNLYNSNAPLTIGEHQRDIPFKGELSLDIYYPTTEVEGKSPVLMYVHGGAWIIGSKNALNFDRFNGAINQLRDIGFTIICPDYTLANNGKSPFPECIRDIYDAISWVKENATEYNLDLDRFGILGESAGAHISMLTVYNHERLLNEDQLPIEVDYLIDAYGPTDLNGIYHSQTVEDLMRVISDWPGHLSECMDISRQIFGFNPAADSIRAKAFMNKYSPIAHLHNGIPPTLIIQGDQDKLVPFNQSVSLNQKMDDLGVSNSFHLLNGVDHAFADATEAQKDDIQKWIVEFVLKSYP
ncbi:MAG: alpha/beta hydrolase [Bacteroidia bacterium]